ncbi:MAG: NHL repeat-containing protein [Sphingobacteriales bacterium]
MACCIDACTKKDFKQTGIIVKKGGGKDSAVVAADSLPSFNSPAGIAIDAAGNLYVADYGNNLIRKITPARVVSTLAGSGYEGKIDATGNLASFNGPTGIAADAAGNLFVADAGNNRIRKITAAGAVTTVAGSDSTGALNGAGINATFFGPKGLTVDASDNVYVADAGNDLIRKINSAGTVSTFAANVSSSTGTLAPNSFNNPTGVALDGTGNIYVANYLSNNILLVNPSGNVSLFAGADTLFGAKNGPANSATFYFPNSVAVDGTGNIYVSDGVNNLIRKITPGGAVSTLAGSGFAGAVDSTGTAASFNGPAGLAVDAAGNVYVADSNNNLIRKITPAGVVTTVAGNGQSGAKNGVAVAWRNRRRILTVPKNIFNLHYKQKPN